MSRLQRRELQARRRGCFVTPAYGPDWTPMPGRWDVFVEAESMLGPRGLSLTRRQATHLAYSIALSAKPKVTVSEVPFQECAASGRECSIEPCGPGGLPQCKYCGELPKPFRDIPTL